MRVYLTNKRRFIRILIEIARNDELINFELYAKKRTEGGGGRRKEYHSVEDRRASEGERKKKEQGRRKTKTAIGSRSDCQDQSTGRSVKERESPGSKNGQNTP